MFFRAGCSNLPYYSAQELIVPEYEPPHAQDSTVSHAQDSTVSHAQDSTVSHAQDSTVSHELAGPERETQEVDGSNEHEGRWVEGDTQSTSGSTLEHCDESTPLTA